MLPFGVPAGFCFLPLPAGDFLAKSAGVRVVCTMAFFGGRAFVFGFGATFFVAVLEAIPAAEDGRGGEGGRPVEGVNRDSSGKDWFSRGFLNIEKLFEHNW
jgi:hypothetical protein